MGYNYQGGSYGCNNYDVGGCGSYGNRNNNQGFVLLVVLFILLIIVGASFMNKDHY